MMPAHASVHDHLRALLGAALAEAADLRTPQAERAALFLLLRTPERAAAFVRSVEEAFQVAFDDEEVDAAFFLSLAHIARRLPPHASPCSSPRMPAPRPCARP